MPKTIKGSCLCQAVSYQFHGPEFAFQYCHCSRCRKFTGSAHSSHLIIDPKNFEWLSGEDMVGRYEPAEAKHFATCFCKKCGSSLPWQSQSGSAMIVTAGTLDQDPETKPTQNIYWDSRPPWREEVSALPQYAELPPRKDKS